MAVTLKMIAEAAGVSVMAVSAVLNNTSSTRVSESTRKRILETAAKFDYSPNISARALAGKRTNLIGCIMRDELEKSFWAEILSGIDRILFKHDIHIVLSVVYGNIEEEIKAFRFLKSKGIDGCFWVPTILKDGKHNFDCFRKYAQDIPLVALNCMAENLNSVAVDEKIGGYLAAEHFYAMGHRKVMVNSVVHPIYSRSLHFAQRCRELGIETVSCNYGEDFFHLLKSVPAIFCPSDMLAVRIYRYAIQHGISIPDNLSIIGYNNMDFSQDLSTPLTTINQPKLELGIAAAEIMLRQLNSPGPFEQKKLSPELIVRESVKKIS